MSRSRIKPTQKEVFFNSHQIIVSKTDLKGRITYANDVFLDIAGYDESEVLGQPHSIIRHPDMPRAVFKLLWETAASGQEIFAYVKNMAKNGDHYWVFAHVTPSIGLDGKVIGFHSNRRVPSREAIEAVTPLYEHVLRAEARYENGKQSLAAGYHHFIEFIKAKNVSYAELVLAL
jgi:PAS domain S-box-containing protein